MAQFTFEIFDPSHTIYLSYYTNVTNSSQLRENIDKFECAFINPRLISSIQQIFSASNRALFNKLTNTSKSHTIYTELIYYLSPSTNISESQVQYGLQNNTDCIIVASFNPETLETVQTAIDGELTRIDRIMEKIDYKKIKELFRIKDTEVYNDRNLTSAVLAVLAIKDVETKAGTQ